MLDVTHVRMYSVLQCCYILDKNYSPFVHTHSTHTIHWDPQKQFAIEGLNSVLLFGEFVIRDSTVYFTSSFNDWFADR